MRSRLERRKPAALAAVVATLALAIGVAACGGDTVGGGANEGEATTAEVRPGQGQADDLQLARLHRPRQGTAPSPNSKTRPASASTTSRTSTKTTAFFGKMQPQLEQGESGGRSIFVVADYMAKQMHDLGYLQEINHADLPTVFENLLAEPRGPGLRPRAQVLGALAERHDRDLGRHLQGARDPLGQRPLRPEIQGQGRRCWTNCAKPCRW